MEASGIIPDPLDLTGQLSILDYMPKFTGNYSAVYLGGLNGNFVAIKVIKQTSTEESVKRKLFREIMLWSSTEHPNIQPFYGFANDREFGAFGALVSPWCLNGDATAYLKQNGGRMVMAERINLWKGVIEGVAYLHNHTPIIIHGDLKPGNILIDDLGVPKICDFGLACVFLEAESTGVTTTSEHTGTPRYLAPELVASDENVCPTAASDLYALGCLGLEFIYDRKPYANRANNLRGQIIRDIKRSLPPAPSPPHQGWACQHTWSLIKQLWRLDPSYRPSASNAVFVLNHMARSIPLIVIKRVVLFSATVDESIYSTSLWIERTRTLLTLSLVSKSFCACATPFLYREVRLSSTETASRLSSLIYTLNSSTQHSRTCDYLPNGYGSYTRALSLRIEEDSPKLSADIKSLLYKVNRVHNLAIHPNEHLFWDESFLSTVHLTGVTAPSLILDREVAQALLYFQRLVIHEDYGLHRLLPDSSQIRHTFLLPNLQDITLRLGIAATNLFQVFTKWVMPLLKSLNCTFVQFSQTSCAALINLLRNHGPCLWYLRVEVTRVDASSLPLWDILSLCSSLRSLVVRCPIHIQLSSFPPHLNLETLDLDSWLPVLEIGEVPYLAQLEGLTTSWRVRFPNLRTAKFQDRASAFDSNGRDITLEVVFHTGDRFYTVFDGRMTYKRWEGSWIDAVGPTIRVDGSAGPSLVPLLPTSGPPERTDLPGFYEPTDEDQILEGGTAMTSGIILP